MPDLTASTREAARRIGLSDTAMHKAERPDRIAREPDGHLDSDKTRRHLLDVNDVNAALDKIGSAGGVAELASLLARPDRR